MNSHSHLKMNSKGQSVPFLLMLALLTDLLTPLLIWKGVLPAETRWISHAAIAAMIPLTYVRMMLVSGVPRPAYFALFVTATGVVVALLNGQGLLATAFGCWLMIQFPLVGLFSYLWPHWPDRIVDRLYTFAVAVVALQVLVQIVQYLTGEAVGDDLAGLFGEHGTGRLVMFLLLVYCLGLGRWLASGQWRTAVLILLLGGLSSALGEMKMFPVAAMALTSAAFVVSAIQRSSVVKMIPFAATLAVAFVICIAAYEKIVVQGGNSDRSIMDYLDRETRERYLGGATQTAGQASYMGRNFALAYGWDTISQNSSTLLFGFGLGARGESRSLGTSGSGLQEERGEFATGTGLLVVIHEMGSFGLIFGAVSYLWIILTLLKVLRRDRESDALPLLYAVLLFTLLWPLWFWYSHILTLRVPMLFYWAALGYVLRESDPAEDTLGPHPLPSASVT